MEEKFLAVAQMVKALNDLQKDISPEPRFTLEFKEDSCIIRGLGTDLALIYSLMWSHCSDVLVSFARDDKGSYVEFVLY